MKLKYLFGAMALPALVASCSNEEILVEKGDLQANRPMAGEVTLAVADGSVESRWTSAGFQAGTDIIGAALMDKYNGETAPKYTLTNEINTNYKFNYTEDGNNASKHAYIYIDEDGNGGITLGGKAANDIILRARRKSKNNMLWRSTSRITYKFIFRRIEEKYRKIRYKSN